MVDHPTIRSINETHTSRPSLSPLSINEPPALPNLPPPVLPGEPTHPIELPPEETFGTAHSADPDELEDEIEQAEEEGDFQPTHRSKTKR
jgi:hypothetical protein